MLKRQKAIVMMALALVASQLLASIDTVDGIDWYFEKQNGSAVIKSTNPTQTSAIDPNTAGAITVPSMLGGYPVTAIGPSAFSGCRNLTSVSILAGVTHIDDSAFYGCSSLESVSLPDGVTALGDYAFYSCGKLRECELPSSVRTIGSSAFSNCDALQSVTFQEDVGTIGSSAFSNCDALLSVTFMGDVGTVGSSAFSNCDALKQVAVKGGVASLGDSAFFRCTKLNDVVFEKDVGSIGTTAFYNCTSLTNVHFGAGLGSMADYVFGNCEALPGINLPEDVTNLAEGAFFNCRALTSFAFPATIAVIPDTVLAGCTNLFELVIPEGVTSIGNGAFLNCSKLANVNLPKGILTIEKRAFEGTAFWNAQPDDSIVMSGNYVVGIKGECPSKAVISNGVETISANMFRDCTNLVEVVLPQGLVSIGDYAFYNTGLRSVTFPSGLEIVGERAFAESKDLVRISNVTGFWCGEGVFEHTGLAAVSVGFDANRGYLAESETNKAFTVGAPYGVMPVPTRSSSYNYQFAGWYTAAKGGALVSETNIVSDTLTMLYAHWKTEYPFTYYVDFYEDSVATWSSGSQTMTNGVAQVLRKNDFITKPGYVFAGWSTVKGGPIVYSDGDTIAESLTAEAGEYVPLYACWVDNAYDVMGSGKDFGTVSSFPVRWTGRLDAETLWSGDRRQTISFKVGSSRKADIVACGLEGSSVPTMELWCKLPSATSVWERVCSVYSSAAASCDFTKDAQYQLRLTSTALTKGSLVYSVSIGTSVDIYFDSDGGIGGGTKPYIANLPYGTLPTATKSECDFEGWYTKGGALVKESATVSPSVTNLIAHWAMRHTYYVSFNANGGQGAMEQVAHKYGETFALPDNTFVRDRYRFDGWALTAGGPVKYADRAKVSNLVQQPEGKLELYAVWSRIREAVDYPIAPGSVTNDVGAVSVISNSLIFTGTLTAATNRHYLVFSAADSDVCRLAVDPRAGLRRGAKLSYGSVLVTDLATTSQEPTFERGDRVCLVVECELQGSETYEYEVSVGATGRTVFYDLNGGVLVGEDASRGTNFNFTVGTPVGYLPTPTNLEDEVFFLGWYDAATNLYDAAKLVPLDGLVLTVKWTDPPPYQYRVRFEANGAEGTMPEVTFWSTNSVSLPSNAFVRAGHTFKGWALSPNGSVEYGDAATIDKPLVAKRDSANPAVLYARWLGEDGVEVDLVDGVFWHYKISGGAAEVCNRRGGQNVAAIDATTAGDITVPLELGGASVVGIGTRAFSGCDKLTSIVIPQGVESIGDYAFENCTGLLRVNFMGPQPSANPNIYAGTSKELWSKVRLNAANKESWTTDGKMLPARWPVPQSIEAGDYVNTRRIGWWLDAPKDDPGAQIEFFHYNATGAHPKMSPEEGFADFPERENYEFLGWFTKPYGGVEVTEENYLALGVTKVYAHWRRIGDNDPQEWGDVVYDVNKAHVYDGYLLDGGHVAGTIALSLAKGKYDKGDEAFSVKMTAKILLLGEGKTVTLSGVAEDVGEDGGSGTLTKGDREVSVEFTPNGMSGDFEGFDIVGARNMFGAKTDWDRRTALASVDDCEDVRSVVLMADGDSPLANGYIALSVSLSKKGKAKVSGMLPDGTKVNVSAQLLVFEDHYVLPVVVPLYSGKKGGFGFSIVYPKDEDDLHADELSEWIANPGKANEFVAGLTAVGVGKGGNIAVSSLASVTDTFDVEGADVDDSLLPIDVAVTAAKSKWTLPKADKVKFDRESTSYDVITDYGNPAGLKLTYTVSKGSFKGSFKVYGVTDAGKSKKYTATVNGTVLDGVGYGTAVIKKVGAVPVVITAE